MNGNQLSEPGRNSEAEHFDQALDRISATASLSDEQYSSLTHLAGDRLARFEHAWSELDTADRRSLLRRLRTREEEDLRLEYNSVYHLAIQDADADVRLAGIEAILEDKSEWLLGRLMSLIRSDPDVRVRAAAARCLGTFTQGAELGDLAPEDVDELQDLLIETLRRHTEEAEVRGAALEAVGFLNRVDVFREIEHAFSDGELRLEAIRAMGHSAEPRWLSRLLGEAEDPDPVVRKAVAAALGEIPDQDSIPALVDMLDDASIEVRLAAIVSLGELGGDEAREGLLYAIEDKRAEVREAASLALAELEFYEDPLSL